MSSYLVPTTSKYFSIYPFPLHKIMSINNDQMPYGIRIYQPQIGGIYELVCSHIYKRLFADVGTYVAFRCGWLHICFFCEFSNTCGEIRLLKFKEFCDYVQLLRAI